MTRDLGKTPRILIADDQKDILRSARLLFKGEGIECLTAESPAEVLFKVREEELDLVLLDLNYQKDTTSGVEGIELIQKIKKIDPLLPLVIMTAWASVELAVEAMKQGAKDFVTKPWEIERLLSIVNTQYALKRSLEKGARLESENRILRKESKIDLVYESSAIGDVVATFEQIAPSNANIVITGENGTGKSLFAKICHQMSDRSMGPFISVNMGGLADGLFESELFGHVKGAFTDAKSDRIGRYELADGGTLFLDEIGNLSMKHQSTLLRLVETGEFEKLGSSKTKSADVRLICATNADLQKRVEEDLFREDLYYRINTVPIRIPALRERTDDILPLASFFLKTYRIKYQKKGTNFSEDAISKLRAYPWPGNVRELDHTIERAVLLSKNNEIQSSELGLSSKRSLPIEFDHFTLDQLEHQALQHAMSRHPGDPNAAAKSLGITRSSLYRRLHKHDVL